MKESNSKHLSKNNNRKYILGLICAFIIGILVSGNVVKAVEQIFATIVIYDNSTSGLKDSSNNDVNDVQSAIDVLYSRSNDWIDPMAETKPTYYSIGHPNSNARTTDPSTLNKEVYVGATSEYYSGPYFLCMKINNQEHCFMHKNYQVEVKHITKIFGDNTLMFNSMGPVPECSNGLGFDCQVAEYGTLTCASCTDNSYCYIQSGGSSNGDIYCGTWDYD